MSLIDCITSTGKFTREELEEFGIFDMDGMSTGRVKKALEGALKKLDEKEARLYADNAIIKKTDELIAQSEAPDRRALRDLFSPLGRGSGFASIEAKKLTIFEGALSQLNGVLENFKMQRFGWYRNHEGFEDVLRVVAGETGGTPLQKKLAKGIIAAQDYMMAWENKVGGKVEKLKGRFLRQDHNSYLIRKHGGGADLDGKVWKKDVTSWIDEKLMVDDLGKQIKGDDLELLLNAMYKNIVSESVDELSLQALPRRLRGKVQLIKNKHRVLHFKDVDSWVAYQKKYGTKDLYGLLMTDLEHRAMKISLMETLGSNPERGFEYLVQSALRRGKGMVKSDVRGARNLFENASGATAADNYKMSGFFNGLRSFEVATKLPGVLFSAIPDAWYTAVTAKLWKMPVMKVYGRYVRNLVTRRDLSFLSRMGVASDFAIDTQNAIRRMSDVQGQSFIAKLADSTIRLSGLSLHTNVLRSSFQMEFMQNLVKMIDGDSLPPLKTMEMMRKHYGIDVADLKALRSQKRVRGVIDATRIEDFKLRAKYVGMIRQEANMGVVTPNLRVMSFMNQGTQAGTVAGEIMRTMGSLKTFPVTVLMYHGSRAASMPGFGNKLSYVASMVAGTTVLGILSYQIKEGLKGNTPAKLDAETVMRGFALGGSGGILTDVIMADFQRRGASLTELAAGPVMADISMLAQLLMYGPMDEIIRREGDLMKRLGIAGATIARRFTPYQMPGLALALRRNVFDHLDRMANPNINNVLGTQRANRRDRGQTQWWETGERLPFQ